MIQRLSDMPDYQRTGQPPRREPRVEWDAYWKALGNNGLPSPMVAPDPMLPEQPPASRLSLMDLVRSRRQPQAMARPDGMPAGPPMEPQYGSGSDVQYPSYQERMNRWQQPPFDPGPPLPPALDDTYLGDGAVARRGIGSIDEEIAQADPQSMSLDDLFGVSDDMRARTSARKAVRRPRQNINAMFPAGQQVRGR